MEKLQQQSQTHETKQRPSILKRAAKFVMWHTVGKHQVDQAIYKLFLDEPNLLEVGLSTVTDENRQAAQKLYDRYKEQLHLDISEPIDSAVPKNSSSTEQ